jgi:Chemotaxis signal transduction protein
MTQTATFRQGETSTSFVLFPMGKKRFALPAETVTELAHEDEPQTFPHTTPLMAGVLIRRGRIVPVSDIASVLIGPEAPPRKFYLIANRALPDVEEWTAIPVSGECELTQAELLPVTGKLPGYVRGLLALREEIVEVLDLDRLLSGEARA